MDPLNTGHPKQERVVLRPHHNQIACYEALVHSLRYIPRIHAGKHLVPRQLSGLANSLLFHSATFIHLDTQMLLLLVHNSAVLTKSFDSMCVTKSTLHLNHWANFPNLLWVYGRARALLTMSQQSQMRIGTS